MGQLTTHILDTASGRPAAGVAVRLFRRNDIPTLCAETTTNSDGRCAHPLLSGDEFLPGTYELEFSIGAYFAAHTGRESDPPFLDEVVIRFSIADSDQHYHVPLLVTPWSYTTYRGS